MALGITLLDKVRDIIDTRGKIADAITEKGVEVSHSEKLSGLPTFIDKIETAKSIDSCSFDRDSNCEIDIRRKIETKGVAEGAFDFTHSRDVSRVVVWLPSSITYINTRAFDAYDLDIFDIHFDGTVEQAKSISFGMNPGVRVLHCTDGDLTV